ncbi:hypothetical protein JCM19233_4893 [Vibrio astriarenae]|nr:hypothetical protein JCM19233_4893 [Vibrio sp. C7]
MGLKVMVIGVEHSKGLSKANDKPYDFAQVNYLAPNEGWQSTKGSCKAVGLDKKTIAMSTQPELFAAFAQLDYPVMCELSLDCDPANPQRNHVVDVKPI